MKCRNDELVLSPALPCDWNYTVPEPPAHSVPVPPGLVLILTGLILMRVIRRRR